MNVLRFFSLIDGSTLQISRESEVGKSTNRRFEPACYFFAIMPKKKLTPGIGAEATVLTRFIHPSELIRDKHPNQDKEWKTKNRTTVLLIGQDLKKINKKWQDVYVFRCEDFENKELYAVKRYVCITKEGDKEHFFDSIVAGEDPPTVEIEEPELLPALPARGGDGFEAAEIETLRAAGIVIDDDNEPAPENLPNTEETSEGATYEAWGHTGICYRRRVGCGYNKAKINSDHASAEEQRHMNRGSWFLLFFPIAYLWDVVQYVNHRLSNYDKINYGELIRYIGIRFLIATVDGHSKKSFWNDNEDIDSRFEGAPFTLNDIMPESRFDFITKNLIYNKAQKPTYKDPFFPIRQLQDKWNENMKSLFRPSWLVCLDESMSKWIQRWTCPGFVFCPRKPWPFGNEWHAIACSETTIIFFVELVEGKDRPQELGEKKYNESGGKTVGLLLRMTESIWHSGKVVVLDSGFCVLQALIEIKKKGLFAAAVIKKRRYWPRHIDGEGINTKLKDEPVGTQTALPGVLDDVRFHVFCLKEQEYTMMIMSTYGTMEEKSETIRSIAGVNKTFKYTEVFHNHFKGRHSVDDNNKTRMHPIALEETWQTTCWENRIFAFLLALSAANSQYAYEYFGNHEHESVIQFRQKMARDLIYNSWVSEDELMDDNRKRSARNMSPGGGCKLIALRAHTKFDGSLVVASESKYPRKLCKCKTVKVRTYCPCSPGVILCDKCFASHVIDKEKSNQT
jgi:hypothetical protein